MATAPEIQGFVARGFGDVQDEFARNFSERRELGAAFAAYVDGELVVDLHGGIADRACGRPWHRDALQLVFSGTKGLVATCLLMLIERGLLDLGRRVADYWPEFAAAGKDDVLVRELVAHAARLPGVDTPVALADLIDDRHMAALLAAQAQSRDPRAEVCYHALTFGWLCGELVRRVDGRSVGRFFADEVAAPLELEVWIGLPDREEGRVTTLELAADWGQRAAFAGALDDPLVVTIWANPATFAAGPLAWNTPAVHAAEIPAANAIGTARSLARLYACLARGGELGDVRLLDEATLQLGRTELSRRHEPILDAPMAFGVGFQLQTERRSLGPPADAFGHGGAGGSMHGAWPAARVGFSYAMNLLRDDEPVDPRPQALLRALDRCVAR